MAVDNESPPSVLDPNPSTRESIVGAIYRAVLNREPDAAGLSGCVYALEALGIGDGIANILRPMLRSQEYYDLRSQKFSYACSLEKSGPRELIGGREVEHIISLGTHCQTSSILKTFGLKAQSLPFDWLFTSPEAILHCLKDDFATFLDRSHYRSIPPFEGDNRAEHEVYLGKFGISNFFPHRDPTDDRDYSYFERSVRRFREVAASDAGKLFVMISRPEHDLKSCFPRLHDWVGSHALNGRLIAIQLHQSQNTRYIEQVGMGECGALYDFIPLSEEKGVGFPDLLDELTVVQLVTRFKIAALGNP